MGEQGRSYDGEVECVAFFTAVSFIFSVLPVTFVDNIPLRATGKPMKYKNVRF
jgi:hypothetical protein